MITRRGFLQIVTASTLAAVMQTDETPSPPLTESLVPNPVDESDHVIHIYTDSLNLADPRVRKLFEEALTDCTRLRQCLNT